MQISRADITGPDATQLTVAIAGSRFTPVQIARLSQAALRRSYTCNTRPGSASNATQTFDKPLEYGTASLYDKLEKISPGDWPAAAQAVCTMAHSLDVHTPSEQTAVTLATLACTYAFPASMPTPPQTLSVVMAVKTSCKGYKRNRGDKPSVWTYPASPDNLPRELYTLAYPDSNDPPVSMILPRFHLMRENMAPLLLQH